MKLPISACLLALGVSAAPLAAQSAADSTAIRATALDYIEGWYTGDGDRMERALHPDLAKRIVFRRGDREQLSHMTAEQLVQATASGAGTRTPESERQMDVTILDIFRATAVVKVEADSWVDYMHIVQFGGRWVIINVLWEVKET